MPSLKFSVPTLLLDERLEHFQRQVPGEARAEVLVITTDSSDAISGGSLNLFEQIVVVSGDFNDGRFFSIAIQIRQLGYRGRLTLVGDLLPDQFSALQSCGFDEVLVLDDLSETGIIDLERAVSLTRPGGSLTKSPLSEISSGNNP